MSRSSLSFKEHRRSTRVRLDVSVGLQNDTGVVRGVTVVVNLHGALIRVEEHLRPGADVTVSVYITGKAAKARVVYVAPDDPLAFGIELYQPQNIWGVSLAPDDWEEQSELAI